MLRKKIPINPNYNFATKKAYEILLKQDIKEFPVEPFEIVKFFKSELYILSWDEFKKDIGVEDPLLLNKKNADGMITRNKNIYILVYKHNVSEQRISFTIAHELGHYILGHLHFFKDENSLLRGELTNEKYRVLEKEANCFAANLLSPLCILSHFNVTDRKHIGLLCDISNQSSKIVAGNLKRFRPVNFKSEIILKRNFFNFFYKDAYLQTIAENFFASSYYFRSNTPSNICRVCHDCNAYIIRPEQKFCHICGNTLKKRGFLFDQLSVDTIEDYPEGKFYQHIETDDNGVVLFCPVCKNHVFSIEDTCCKICDAPLKNICLKENKSITGENRYCPDCASISLFHKFKMFEKIIEVQIPNLLTFKNGIYEDYIEYEYWNFIIAAVKNYEKNLKLYAVLVGSKAIRDDGHFVVFIENRISKKTILENKQTLMKCIKKYGFTKIPISEVDCICEI